MKNAKQMKETKLNSGSPPRLISELVSNAKKNYLTAHAHLEKQAVALGKKDGFLGVPAQNDSQVSPNEDLLRNEYRKLLAECRKKGKPYMDGPHLAAKVYAQKLIELEENGEANYTKELDALNQKRDGGINEINRAFQDREHDLAEKVHTAEREYREVRLDLQHIQGKTGRNHPLIHFKSGFLYFLLLLGIGLAEVPLNLQIFQKFGEAFFITMIMASSLAIAIPVLAHFTGVFIKQRKEKKEYTYFAILCITIFAIFNFGISIFRTDVLAEAMGQAPNDLNIIIFTCLNLILFIIGVLAAYFRHDESYELEHIYDDYQKAKTVFNKENEALNQEKTILAAKKNEALKVVHNTFEKGKTALNNKKDTLVIQHSEYVQRYDELLNSFVALEEIIDACYHIAIGKYRSANISQRKDRRSPDSWNIPVPNLNLHFAAVAELDPN